MVKLQEFPNLSVIIPTLNEASRLPLLLADLKAWPGKIDITIVDGGSSDLTVSIAQIQGLNVIKSLKSNRGHQLNLGASNAKGEWLLFLHADSRLDTLWEKKLLSSMSNLSSKNIAWYFDFKIKKNKLQFRILEILVAFRSFFLNRPYGDQGLLIHKQLYNSSGGYSSLKIMEDLDLIIRITKKNKVRRIKSNLYTDEKRWNNSNIIMLAIKNAKLRKKWRKGYDNNELVKEYYS